MTAPTPHANVIDRRDAPAEVFDVALAGWEAREADPDGWEQRVENAANAAHRSVCDCGRGATDIDRQMVAAALTADAALRGPATDDPATAACDHEWGERGGPGDEWLQCWLCDKEQDL